MIFCLGEGKYESQGAGYQKNSQIFNKDVSADEFDKAKSALNVKNFKLPIAKWVDKKDMTAEEKKNWKSYTETGGYLKTLSYQDAWKELWSTLSSEDKNFFKTFKNFDAEIFEKITGIKVESETSLKGKTVKVEVDGQKYEAIIQ